MTTYKTSDLGATLVGYLVNVDELLANSHPTMREYAQAKAEAHNACLELLGGFGKTFASEWEPKPVADDGSTIVSPTDAGVFAPLLDNLTDAAKLLWWQTMDAERARHRVMEIVLLDPAHPVAKHWKVIQANCYQPGQLQPWPEIEAALSAVAPVEG